MNPWLIALAAGTAAWFAFAKQNHDLVAGKAYEAIFLFEPKGTNAITNEQLLSLLPPGAGVEVDGNTFRVTFVAPTKGTISDINTPVGNLKLQSLKAMS